MTINRRSVALGLTVGLLAGGTGAAVAATTSGTSASSRSTSATTGTGTDAWGGYGPGRTGNGAPGGYGPGWNGSGARGGYGADWNGNGAWGAYGEIDGIDLGRTATGAAAGYLGLSTAELKSRLRSGKTLAELASSQHKSASGLENAIVAAISSSVQSDHALSAGEKATITAGAKAWIDAIVEHNWPVGNGSWDGAQQGPMLPW